MLRKICFAECGKRPPLPRVLGGKEAIPHSWPWQAMIEVKRRQDGGWEHKCGASLIHPEWIVTAAHCLAFQPDPRIYRIVLGLYMRKKKNTREIKKKKKTLSKQEQNKDETNKQTKKLKAILVCIFMVFPYRSIYLFILSFVINVVFFDFLQTR